MTEHQGTGPSEPTDGETAPEATSAEGTSTDDGAAESGQAAAVSTADDGTATTEDTNDAEDAATARPKRRRVLRKLLITLGALALVLALVVGGGFWYLENKYSGNIDRVSNVFADVTDRPAAATPTETEDADPVTFLLVGSDTRADIAAGELPDARSDAIMIARLSGDRKNVQIISIPRDSWVTIPGYGKNKINAAYAYGGPSLLIQTVEDLTDVRIDHYAAIDFDGLIDMTDALGGVDVTVAETTTWGDYTFTKGVNHLDGDAARWYVGQRYDLPGGDFDREKRQQNYLRAMFTKLLSKGTFSSVSKLTTVLDDITKSIALDDDISTTQLLKLAYSGRNVTEDNVDFFTAPVRGTGTEGSASVVYLNPTEDKTMWGYLNSDSLGAHADEFADEQLGDNPY